MNEQETSDAVVRYVRGPRYQVLACRDIQAPETLRELQNDLLPGHIDLVYSDPPWNPGNATYWRTHAGLEPCPDYAAFVERWATVGAECIQRGARHVLVEQSSNEAHAAILMRAIEARPGWTLPLLERWTVYYGSPGSKSVSRPNTLLHFGERRLSTDPSGMHGEPMTIRACAGLGLAPGATVVDMCIGKGMTSRMAHYFEWDCVGTEINPKRLAKAADWLRRQGYDAEDRNTES